MDLHYVEGRAAKLGLNLTAHIFRNFQPMSFIFFTDNLEALCYNIED